MSSTSIIQLNIGGTHFQTSRTTLTRYDGFFKTLMETEYPVAKNEPIFVDRSSKHFEKILNFMRDGTIVLLNCPEEVREIQNEAQYYLLTELVELCEMGRKEKFGFRQLNNLMDETDAIVNSAKQAVLIIPANSSLSPGIVVKMALQYQEILDVFFTVNATSTKWLLYDKTKNEYGYDTCYSYELQNWLKNRLAHLL